MASDDIIEISSSPPTPRDDGPVHDGATLSQALTVPDDDPVDNAVYLNASGHDGNTLSQALTVSSDSNEATAGSDGEDDSASSQQVSSQSADHAEAESQSQSVESGSEDEGTTATTTTAATTTACGELSRTPL